MHTVAPIGGTDVSRIYAGHDMFVTSKYLPILYCILLVNGLGGLTHVDSMSIPIYISLYNSYSQVV